ncbi:NADH-ubiquinone oxidoreductase-F iron-sulfur binding region domain-containing protein [Nocardioides panaciterrulae]|uniref:NADH:ubiquinone oxidoreductase subunit F (NADH-binding) n=1 Tax=Nocardioides panaciterrulae TaxID=661492 RepID=A0A7Y9JCH4_9ACTN|nr:NADH-ubiquinone oxidoreductase-F iron-sulfur binding region domain-containing protein [Nocardioides panaciterrulae]NYD43281.1 NADH:ubiquinone oxidoreductase subunit F (NADH-binding) [Nocardioides panaciterrulae]
MSALASPVPVPQEVAVHEGPALLAGLTDGPSLAAHRGRYGALPEVGLAALRELIRASGLRGRGGAAFPFVRKLDTAAGSTASRAPGRRGGREAVVVVNLSEGEPGSAKDSALALTRPHLVLDGAVATACALRAREVHVVVAGDRPAVRESVVRALDERDDAVPIRQHATEPRFVGGQARAVVELLAGRPNLPVTSWAPEAVAGLAGRPTLLSNAETWAHVGLLVLRGGAAYRHHGTDREPGTTLLTLTRPGFVPHVHEVGYGTRLRDLLPPGVHGHPALVGGFHGSWATWPTLRAARVSVPGMSALGAPLGAGVLLAPGGSCPLTLTSRVVDYLAGQSAGRCGPCHNGLPALASVVRELVHGDADGGVSGAAGRAGRLAALVTGRGACAHPDGTARLVRSVLAVFPDEVAEHAAGRCAVEPVGSAAEDAGEVAS